MNIIVGMLVKAVLSGLGKKILIHVLYALAKRSDNELDDQIIVSVATGLGVELSIEEEKK